MINALEKVVYPNGKTQSLAEIGGAVEGLSALIDEVDKNTSAISSITSQLSALVDDVGTNTSVIASINTKLGGLIVDQIDAMGTQATTKDIFLLPSVEYRGMFVVVYEVRDVGTGGKAGFAILSPGSPSKSAIVYPETDAFITTGRPAASKISFNMTYNSESEYYVHVDNRISVPFRFLILLF